MPEQYSQPIDWESAGKKTRSGWWILFAAIALCVVFRALHVAILDRYGGTDFSAYWLAGRWMIERPENTPLYYPNADSHHENRRIWTTSRGQRDGASQLCWYVWAKQHPGIQDVKFYLYPPLFAWVFVPISHLPIGQASIVWTLISVVTFIASVLLIAATIRPRTWSYPVWATLLLTAAMLCKPLWWTFELFQNSALLVFLWALLLFCLSRRRDAPAGIVLGVLAWIKFGPPLLLMLWLISRRRWRSVPAFCGVSLIVVGAWAFSMGTESIRMYFAEMTPLMSTSNAYIENQSLLGFLLRQFDGMNPSQLTPGIGSGLFPLYKLLVGILMIFQAVWLIHRRNAEDVYREFAALTVLVLVISPVSWTHHYLVALIPLAVLAAPLIEEEAWSLMALSLIPFILINIPWPSYKTTLAYPRWLLSIHLVGGALLWVVLLLMPATPGSVAEGSAGVSSEDGRARV